MSFEDAAAVLEGSLGGFGRRAIGQPGMPGLSYALARPLVVTPPDRFPGRDPHSGVFRPDDLPPGSTVDGEPLSSRHARKVISGLTEHPGDLNAVAVTPISPGPRGNRIFRPAPGRSPLYPPPTDPTADSLADAGTLGDVEGHGDPVGADPAAASARGNFAWDVELPTELEPEQARELGLARARCPSCDAGIIGAPDSLAAACPFCGNNYVDETRLRDSLIPTRIVPFRLTRDDAMRICADKAAEMKLAPPVFRSDAAISKITGVYVPYWLHSACLYAEKDFRRTKMTREYGTTSVTGLHGPVLRAATMRFEHVPVAATRAIDRARTEAIEPFDLQNAKPFGTAYLAGFRASTATVPARDAHPIAAKRIETSAIGALRATVTGDGIVSHGDFVHLESGRAELVHLPVWMLNVKSGGRVHSFAINGQTGKLAGDFPISPKRRLLAGAAIAAAVTLFVSALILVVALLIPPLRGALVVVALLALVPGLAFGIPFGIIAGRMMSGIHNSAGPRRSADHYLAGSILMNRTDSFFSEPGHGNAAPLPAPGRMAAPPPPPAYGAPPPPGYGGPPPGVPDFGRGPGGQQGPWPGGPPRR